MSQNLWTHIRTVSDFPKAGIEFYDISPLLNQHLNQLIDALIDALPSDILAATDALVAVESRGFVLASLLAARLDKGLILIRKTGKLPPLSIVKAMVWNMAVIRLRSAATLTLPMSYWSMMYLPQAVLWWLPISFVRQLA